jgi:AcrR family transcriptional regulator
MSSGHLNYHFRKKEEILEALYFEMVATFDQRVKHLPEEVITLERVRQEIYTSMQRMVQYRFFWVDIYNLLRQNEKIKTHFQAIFKDRFQGYEFLFAYLEKTGLLRPFSNEKEQSFLIERMIEYSNTWIYNSALYQRTLDEAYIHRRADQLLFFLYPYLADEGRAQMAALVPDFFGDV